MNVLRLVPALALAIDLLLNNVASAVELRGGFIVIEGLGYQYWSRGINVTGEATSYTPPTTGGRTTEIAILNGGALLAWEPSGSPSCQDQSGFTRVSILYSLSGAKHGNFKCKEQKSVGINGTSTSNINGDYSSRATVSGSIITLEGTMRSRNDWKQPGTDGSLGYLKKDAQYHQNIKLQIEGNSCQVLSFRDEKIENQLSTGTTNIGAKYKATEEMHVSNVPTGSVSCRFQ